MSSARSCCRRAWVAAAAALLAACGPPCDDPGRVCTIAGVPGSLGFNGDGLPADATWLYFPTALAWSAEGRLLVDDFNNMRIRELGDDGVLRTIVGNGVHAYATLGIDALETPLENPIDIDVLPDGRLVIAELHAARVLVLEPDGTLAALAGVEGEVGFSGDGGPASQARLSQAAGVAVDPAGRVVVADTENHCVRVIDPSADHIDRVAGNGAIGLHDGRDASFRNPQRVLAVGDVVYVADTRNHAVRRVDADGEVVTLAGSGTPGSSGDGGPAVDALLDQPYGLALAPDGSLLVADAGNGRIRRLTPDGRIETLAGAATGPVVEGALAAQATFDFPVDVLVGPDGDVYVADMKNGAVRRIAGAL